MRLPRLPLELRKFLAVNRLRRFSASAPLISEGFAHVRVVHFYNERSPNQVQVAKEDATFLTIK